MSTSVNAFLGILFLVLGILAVALMFQFWGYPYDNDAKKSSCPQWKMNIHRLVGAAYVLVYIILMIQMVPRLWTYQIEFPARTVAHIIFGITIGFILLLKISILRFWRHFEEWMPVLGVSLLLCTFILTGLSIPLAFKEQSLHHGAIGGHAFSKENQTRVRALLLEANLPNDDAIPEGMTRDTLLNSLVSKEGLSLGRDVLLKACVTCHDIKTAIAKPRVPADWYRTVKRMAQKPTLGDPIDQKAQLYVSAYLVAITPTLTASLQQQKEAQAKQAELRSEMTKNTTTMTPVDPMRAKDAFERVCSQCHDSSDVEDEPPATSQDVTMLVDRMISNGLESDEQDLLLVHWYLNNRFVKK